MKREKFSLLIEPIRDQIKVKDPYRNVLTWKEIWIIVEYLGAPDSLDGIDPLYYNSITRLADLYKVEWPTFNRWLLPLKDHIKQDELKRRFFTPKEVRLIINHLGHPGYID